MGQVMVFNRYFDEKLPKVIDRYVRESERLSARSTGAGGNEYRRRRSIADMARFPWRAVTTRPASTSAGSPISNAGSMRLRRARRCSADARALRRRARRDAREDNPPGQDNPCLSIGGERSSLPAASASNGANAIPPGSSYAPRYLDLFGGAGPAVRGGGCRASVTAAAIWAWRGFRWSTSRRASCV